MLAFLLVVGVLFLLILASGAYVFAIACVRKKEIPWLVEEEIKKTSYGKYYECISDTDCWLRDNDAKDIYITSEDGLRLRGRWVACENPKGTILFAHGYRSTPLLDFGVALPFYHERGFNILLPDQRSHGESQGRFITFGVKESADMLRWILYINKRNENLPILLSGMSMGASTMLFLIDEDLPDNVKGIIADCGFTSPKDIISYVFTNTTHLPATLFVWATDVFARLIAGFSFSEKDTRKTLQKNSLSILMVHGESDDFVPCWMSKEGYAACTGNKDLFIVKDAGHGVSFLVDPDGYGKKLVEFVDNILDENTET